MKKKLFSVFLLLAVLSLTACGQSAAEPGASPPETVTGEGQTQESEAQEEPEDEEQIEKQPDSGIPDSPLPDRDAFIEQYNRAAEALGAIQIDPGEVRPMSWNSAEGLRTVPGGFNFDTRTGAIMFDPYYVRIVAREDDMTDMILLYAAAAAAVTGLPADQCLEVMTEMVENAEEDTWDNGYEVNLGDAELGGLEFYYEIGRASGISQMTINWDDGHGLSDLLAEE